MKHRWYVTPLPSAGYLCATAINKKQKNKKKYTTPLTELNHFPLKAEHSSSS